MELYAFFVILITSVGDIIARVFDFVCFWQLWNTRHNPPDVKPNLKESLENLGLDYLDLYLIHWPISFKVLLIKVNKVNYPRFKILLMCRLSTSGYRTLFL